MQNSAVAPPDWESGEVTPPVGAPEVLLPSQIKLEGGIVWSYPTLQNKVRSVRPGREILGDFIQLVDFTELEKGRRVLQFARRWGVLQVCEHGLPAHHGPLPYWPDLKSGPWCESLRVRDGVPSPTIEAPAFSDWQPLEAWLHYARQAQALINIANHLHQDHLGLLEDWATVFEWSQDKVPMVANTGVKVDPSTGEVIPKGPLTQWSYWEKQTPGRLEATVRDKLVAYERWQVGKVVSEWLHLGEVEVGLDWQGPAPRIRLEAFGLFGALAVQLLLTVGRTDGWAMCSGCGAVYPTGSRRLSVNRRHYCEKCGRRQAVKDAVRAFRRRERDHPDRSKRPNRGRPKKIQGRKEGEDG